MSKRIAKSAELLQTLVFFDGPQLALFESDRGFKMLAIAVGEPSSENVFFACEVTNKAFAAYKNGRRDLRFMFKYASNNHYYFFDWSQMDNRTVQLRRANTSEVRNERLYPERGFFEEDHTEGWADETSPLARGFSRCG